jgi:hypothetical protein
MVVNTELLFASEELTLNRRNWPKVVPISRSSGLGGTKEKGQDSCQKRALVAILFTAFEDLRQLRPHQHPKLVVPLAQIEP